MRLVILSAPVTKKNSQRMARTRTGRAFILPSSQYEKWARSAVPQLRAQWRRPAIIEPCSVAAVVYRERATGDLLNYLSAIHDVLETAGVVENDRLIVCVDGSRLDKDAKRPRVEIQIGEVCR